MMDCSHGLDQVCQRKPVALEVLDRHADFAEEVRQALTLIPPEVAGPLVRSVPMTLVSGHGENQPTAFTQPVAPLQQRPTIIRDVLKNFESHYNIEMGLPIGARPLVDRHPAILAVKVPHEFECLRRSL